MTFRTLALAGALTLPLLMTGCASQQTITYGDATAVETTSLTFGSTDLQMISAKMVDDLLVFPPVVELTTGRRPVITLGDIDNRTSEHIETGSITNTIRSKLINSGRFRFVDMKSTQQIRNQLDYQNASGMVDPTKAIRMGQAIGAEFILNGDFDSIVKYNGKTKDVYYKFTLNLVNIRTQIVEWSGEKEIRKTGTKSTFGL